MQWTNSEGLAIEHDHGGLIMYVIRQGGLNDAIDASDSQQLGIQLSGENHGLRVAVRPSHRLAAQRAIDMDVAIGDDFSALADHADDDEVGALGIDALARAQGVTDDHGCGRYRGFGGGFSGVCGRTRGALY